MKERKNPKESLNRRLVGKKIKQQIMSGEKVNISKAMEETGYANSTIRARTGDIVKSREVREELESFEDQLEELIQMSIVGLREDIKKKKLTGRDKTELVDKFKKLKQLTTGKPTDITMDISWSEDEA